jgi:hypothetical protein
MKQREVFETLNPPAFGLTRLKGKMQRPKMARWYAPVLAFSTMASVIAIGIASRGPAIDLMPAAMQSPLAALLGVANDGQNTVSALNASVGAVELLSAKDSEVLMYRVAFVSTRN